ncbi:MAG: Rieske 2Fe-2S domain-containing protein [Acidimicrobiia bacterium]|nr:Rieske 2Fe-2S domain-containing protein [Acidimicrobiia bacterium]
MDQGTMIVLVIGAVLIIGVGSVVLLGRHAAQSDQTQNAVSTKSGRSSEAETVEDGVTKTKTETYEPISEEEIGVSRRKFLNRSIYALLGLGFGLPYITSMLSFLIPTGKGGFGGLIGVTKGISEILSTIETEKKPYYIPEARAYIVPFPKDNAVAVEAANKVAEYTKDKSIFDAMTETGIVALYQRCPHLGCRVPWCGSSQWFECPCHGSKFNRVGEKVGGPAPRGMDRFPVVVAGDKLTINTNLSSIVSGPPIGTDTTKQGAEGPLCV